MDGFRLGAERDKSELLRMALDFKAHSPYALFPHSVEKIGQTIDNMLADNGTSAIVIVAINDKDNPVGVIAGMAVEPMWGYDRVATETIWWVDPGERRGKIGTQLKEGFEAWASHIGCFNIAVAHLEGTPESKLLSRYYKRSGYKLIEQTWIKRI